MYKICIYAKYIYIHFDLIISGWWPWQYFYVLGDFYVQAGLRTSVLSIPWERWTWLELAVYIHLILFLQLECNVVKGRSQSCSSLWLMSVLREKGAAWLTQVDHLLPMIPKSQSSENEKMFLSSFTNKIWSQLSYRLFISFCMDVCLSHYKVLMCLIMGCYPRLFWGGVLHILIHTHTPPAFVLD